MAKRRRPREPKPSEVQPAASLRGDDVVVPLDRKARDARSRRRQDAADREVEREETKPRTGAGSRKPYKLTPERQASYLAALERGATRSAAAAEVDVTRGAIIELRKRDHDFAKACEAAELSSTMVVEDALFEAAVSGNTTAIIFWLTNRDPGRWQDRRAVAGAGGVPDLGEVGSLTPEERLAKMGELRAELDRRIAAGVETK